MTLTSALWAAVAVELVVVGVRLARRPDPVRIRAEAPGRPVAVVRSVPAIRSGSGSGLADADWRPRVTSGCGR